MPVRTVSQRFSHLQWRRLFKEVWCRPTTTADFGPSFRQIPNTSHVCLLEDKIQDRGMFLFTISYGSYGMDQRSGDGWFSGWFKIFVINRRFSNAKFWSTLMRALLSALNKIIHNSHFKRRISLEEPKGPKRGPFLSRKTDCLPDLWVLPRHWSQRFCRELCGPVYNWSSKWWYSGVRFEVGRNFIINDENPIWWHLWRLYKLRIRESEKLETVLELYIMEIYLKKLGLDYHRLKTMVKRRIEQNLRMKNFGARHGNYEKNAVVKNQGTKQRVQRILGDCWQRETNGQCVKGNNCSFRHDMDKRGKVHHQILLRILSCGRMSDNHRGPQVPEERAPVVECRGGLARITLKELAITHSVKDGILQNACSTRPRVVLGLGKSADTHTVKLMNSRQKGLRKWQKCSGSVEEGWLARKRTCYRPMSRSIGETWEEEWNWDKIHLNVNHLMHDNWVAYFRTWRRRTTSFQPYCPILLVDCLLSWNTTSFRNQDQWMTIVQYQNFLHTKIRVERLPNILVLSLVPQEMSLNIEINRIFPLKFSCVSPHLLSKWSQIPCGLFSSIEYHFFSDLGPINDHCLIPNFFASMETTSAFAGHYFSLSFDPQEVSLNIDIKRILPVKFSGVSPNLNSKCLTSWLSCNLLNPVKIFRSNAIGSPSIMSKFQLTRDDLNHPNLCFHASFDWEFSKIFPRHNRESEKDVHLRAL